MTRNRQIPSPKLVFSAAASLAATAMLVRSFAKEFIPYELRHFLFVKFHHLLSTFSNELTLVIDEFDGLNGNQLFRAAEIYLGTIIGPSTKRLRVSLPDKEEKINVAMEKDEELCDTFGGFQLKWRMIRKQIQTRYITVPGDYNPTAMSELRCYELQFHKKHKNKVLQEYLPYVLEKSKAAKEEKKTLKLFTVANDRMRAHIGNPWQSVNLDHPATFDTVAMDMDMKKMIKDDLERFVGRKELYKKVGKAWKRGYLLFGPPGTGKSSLVAAMANYLKFDVYDLELADIRNNSDLRRTLISTANHSILVVEDIDCSIELTEKRSAAPKPAPNLYPYPYSQGNPITLSGFLNFIDGLWSSCGDERIIVFTTNHKEKLDPALLRPGRMDVHIHMSYCTPCGLKLLASNYLGITEHPLLLEVEQLMKVTKVTPAEVGEQLLKNSGPDSALKGLIEFLEEKKNAGEVEAYKKHQQASKAELVLKPEGGEFATVTEQGSMNLEIMEEQLMKMKKVPPAQVKKELVMQDVAGNGADIRDLIKSLPGKKEIGEVNGTSAVEILPVSEEKGENKSGEASI